MIFFIVSHLSAPVCPLPVQTWVPTISLLLGGCRRTALYLQGRQFFASVRCTLFRRRHRRPHWCYYPCNLQPPGIVGEGNIAQGVCWQQHSDLLGSYASLPHKRGCQEPPSHLMDEPHRCRPTKSQLHWRTPPPSCWRLAAGLWREVRWQIQSWQQVGAPRWQSLEDGMVCQAFLKSCSCR